MLLASLASAAVALVVTFVTVCVLLPIARRYGLVDVPCGRKDHDKPTPVVGGIAILVGVLIVGGATNAPSASLMSYFLAATLIVVVGVLDDLRDLSWRFRVLIQSVAALIIVIGGVRAERVGGLLDLGIWAIPFTVFATVGVINAVNMIDGTDGLAGSQVAIALTFFAGLAVQVGNSQLAQQILILLGAVGGFLALNLRYPGQARARVFLGNSGSALLGLSVAWAAYRLAESPGHSVSGIVAPWMIAIPLIDCVVVMSRRLLAGNSPFSADHSHIHHLLLDAGHSPQKVVMLTASISIFAGFAAVTWYHTVAGEATLVLVFLGLIALHFGLTRKRERAIALLHSIRTGAPIAISSTARPALGGHSSAQASNAHRRVETR